MKRVYFITNKNLDRKKDETPVLSHNVCALSDVAEGHVVERDDKTLKGEFMNEKTKHEQDEAKPEAQSAEQINAVMCSRPATWVITIGAGYGSFFFVGTEDEAEELRANKSKWERAGGWKRLADDIEIETKVINLCKNHKNYKKNSIGRKTFCQCGQC